MTKSKTVPASRGQFLVRQGARYVWPLTIAAFGALLKRRTNAEAREQFMQEVNPLIEQMGLAVPDPNKGRLYL